MNFAFERPLALLALPVLAAAVLLLGGSARLLRGRRLRVGLRLAAAGALGLALGGLSAGAPARPLRVELLDVSASFRPRRPAAEAFLEASRRSAEAAGAEAVRLPFAEGTGASARPDGTDLAGALRTALAAGATEILLASDGRATAPGTLEAAALLARRGVPVRVFLPDDPAAPSLAIESVRVPERVRPGERFPLEVAVAWTGPGALAARVRAGEKEVPLALPAGGGRAVATIECRAERPGLQPIEVALEPRLDDDLVPEDERARPAVLVEPEAEVLLVGAVAGDLGGVRAAHLDPSEVPAGAADLALYEAVVIGDVPADALGPTRLEALARYVEAGGGLLAVGARHAFGAGGYAATPLERVLPVSSEPGREGGRLALAIALDRSGTMNEPAAPGLSKFQAAVRVLARPLGDLSPDDLVGALVFDKGPEWVRREAPLGDPNGLVAELAAAATGGETDIFPALEAAIAAVRAVPAERRHVLLVSDGRSEATPDRAAALGAFAPPEGVTVSVIAIGKDADRPLLERIAAAGRGRFVEAAAGGEALLGAFEREVDPRRLGPVVEGPLAVRGGGPVSHAARVSAKPRARVLLEIPGVGPLLAEAPAGAGNAAAYASGDLAPNAAALAAALGRVARPAGAPGYSISIAPDGLGLKLEAEAPTPTPLVVRLAGGAERGSGNGDGPLVLEETAPRRYEARLEQARGPVLASLLPAGAGGRPLATAVHAPALPLEAVPGPADEALLGAIAETTGGALLRPGAGPPPIRLPAAGGRRSLVPILSLAAALLFLLDLLAEVLLTGRALRLK